MSQTIFHTVKTDQYTVIENATLRDPDLSFRATGLLAFLLSLPSNWSTNITHLSDSKREGRDAVKAALSELMEAGYVKKFQEHGDDGKFLSSEMFVRESTNIPWPDEPLTEKPSTVNPSTEKPSTVNPLLQKKDNTKELVEQSKEKTNSETLELELEIEVEDQTESLVNEIWDAWVSSRLKHNSKAQPPKFTKKREKLIRDRLEDYSAEDLVLAVTGWRLSDFHCGQNDQGKVYNGIELLLRDEEKIEQFIGYHSKPPSKQTITEKWSDPNRKTKSGTMVLNNMEQ